MTNVVWIDPEIDNLECAKYAQELKTFPLLKVNCYKDIDEGLDYIKAIQFEETKIILSGKIYNNFILKFKENIRDIFIIPKIIIFTYKYCNILQEDKYNFINDKFYNFGGIKTDFEEIKKFIRDENINIYIKKEEPQLTFEYIDNKSKLILPLLLKALINKIEIDEIELYTESLYSKYSKNKDIEKLLKSIK